MLYRHYFLSFFLLLIFFSFGASYGADLSTLLNSLKTMQANFVQTVYDNHHKAIQQSYGHMALSRPGKFRWEVTKPIPQLIIANNNRLWIYDKDLQQVTIRKLTKSAGETPALLLSHVNTSIEADFTVKELKSRPSSMQTFELIPKNHDNLFALIRLEFSGGGLKEMGLKDHLGHSTLVKFVNTNFNKILSDKLFIFHAANNIDVIDETHKR